MTEILQVLYWIITASTSIIGVAIEVIKFVGERRRRRKNKKVGKTDLS